MEKAYLLTLYTSDRSMRTRTNVVSLLLLQIPPPLFSEYLWALQVFLVHSAAWASSSYYYFWIFNWRKFIFYQRGGRPFWRGEKEICFFFLYTYSSSLSLPLSELASKVTGNKQANHRPRNNTIRVTVHNRTTTASAATYETSTEPAPNPKPPTTTTTTTTHSKTKNPPATTTTTTSRQQQEQFQAEIDYEQTASSLFDLSLVEYSPPKVFDRNNFGHFAPGKSSSSPSSSSSSGRQGTPETRMCVPVVDQLVVLFIWFFPLLYSLLSAEIRWSGNWVERAAGIRRLLTKQTNITGRVNDPLSLPPFLPIWLILVIQLWARWNV